MPLTYTIRDGILCFEAIGDVDYAEGLSALSNGSTEYRDGLSGRARLVFDLCQSTENRDSSEIRGIADRLSVEFDGGKLAMIVSEPLYFGLSRMFAAHLEPAGFESSVFHDADAAFAWIRGDS